MIKTAVLMATYNGENFIIDQLESIKNQEMKPDYVIFRDDKSTDRTVEKIRSFIEENSLENWIINQNDNNLGWRLNFRALLLDVLNLDVDYVFFSDQDDTWYLNKNKIQVDIMETNKNIDVLSADVDIVKMSEKATIPEKYEFNDSNEVISKYPQTTRYISYRQGWTFCVRKNFIEKVIPFWREGLNISHDNILSGVSWNFGTGYNLNMPVGAHKRHGTNASGNFLTLRSENRVHVENIGILRDYYIVLTDILENYKNNNAELYKEYRDFYIQRYKNANGRNIFGTVKQLIFSGKYYINFSNKIRDIVFLLKK
ncbi:glycosyltransferase [Floricoccus penangensis]|uniref:glycosyltransferase n=1 Tax=Floricoccus penangensis TaxID=1859475 RepID=UPI00203A6094|nr:glycosyltransferase [Floricoccus penangensis]URZ87770.1 glycosyltransferase [Floricoccus penangensis]